MMFFTCCRMGSPGGEKVLNYTVADTFLCFGFIWGRNKKIEEETAQLKQIKERHLQKLKKAQKIRDAVLSKVRELWEVQCKHKGNKERLAPKMVATEKKNLLSSATGMVFKNVPYSYEGRMIVETQKI